MFAAALASGNYFAHDDELGGQPTFPLSALAAVADEARHPLALEGSFGDATLLDSLAPYRRMREALIAADYRFVRSEELSVAERIAPELRLLDVLRRRRVPYSRMSVGFGELIAAAPAARFDDFGLVRICTPNNTPHEGAHATIYEIARSRAGELEGRRLVEALVVGEGFAMAFEFWLALLIMKSPRRAVPIFFGLNAAQNPYLLRAIEAEQPGMLMKLAEVAETAPAATMKLFAAAALIANVRPKAKSVREDMVAHLVQYAGFEPARLAEARVLVRSALALDDNFRNVTASTFFRFNDLESAFESLCALPLEYHFGKDALFDACIPQAIGRMTDAAS